MIFFHPSVSHIRRFPDSVFQCRFSDGIGIKINNPAVFERNEIFIGSPSLIGNFIPGFVSGCNKDIFILRELTITDLCFQPTLFIEIGWKVRF